jgi:hypothetical protein
MRALFLASGGVLHTLQHQWRQRHVAAAPGAAIAHALNCAVSWHGARTAP